MAKRSGARLYQKKKGGTFYAWFFHPSAGERVTICTHTHDRHAAKLFLAKIERDAFEAFAQGRPAPHGAASGHTVAQALEQFVTLGGSDLTAGTWHMVGVKSGHLLRLLGATEVGALTIDSIQTFIETRLGEGAARETIRKELSVFRQVLKLAQDRGRLRQDPRLLFPRFRVRYVPRERHLTKDEAQRLFQELPQKRRLWVLIAVILGARLSEVESVTWADFDLKGGWVRLRGTKTSGSDRRVPIPVSIVPILEAVEVKAGPVVAHWSNVRRDLADACRRAGIATVTPNDLRRTFASWMKQQGEDSAVVAKLMGHASTRMVDLVYGRLNEENFRTAARRLPCLELPAPGSKWVAEPARKERTRRAGRTSAASSACATHGAESGETQGTLQSTGPLMFGRDEVPGPGIEPGTRGFSVPCSTS